PVQIIGQPLPAAQVNVANAATRAAVDIVLAAHDIVAHYDPDDPMYTGSWYVVTRGRTVGIFRRQSPASTATLGFSGQNWSRARSYQQAELEFYDCALHGGVTNQPTGF
ncbi:hypothetical protein K466DRAFT_607551, partial [Polyporus arcularius HHB13444]